MVFKDTLNDRIDLLLLFSDDLCGTDRNITFNKNGVDVLLECLNSINVCHGCFEMICSLSIQHLEMHKRVSCTAQERCDELS